VHSRHTFSELYPIVQWTDTLEARAKRQDLC